MASRVRFQIDEKDLDSEDVTSDERSYVINCDYTASTKGAFSATSSNTYYAIGFGNVTTAALIRINSTQGISIKVNGGSQELTGIENLIFMGEMTSISYKNNSGETTDIIYEIYGA